MEAEVDTEAELVRVMGNYIAQDVNAYLVADAKRFAALSPLQQWMERTYYRVLRWRDLIYWRLRRGQWYGAQPFEPWRRF